MGLVRNVKITCVHKMIGGGGGVPTYKMGMYVPPYVKKKGAYGADQTEKVGAFNL